MNWTRLPKNSNVCTKKGTNFIFSGKTQSRTVAVVTNLSARPVSSSVSSRMNWTAKSQTWNNISKDLIERRRTIVLLRVKLRLKIVNSQK